ncbi:hypothetical protein Q7P36_003739 [Cladosporium allicinum]
MQFSLNVLAMLAASASVVTATPPRRYAPQAYQPVQYSNNVPWTSSTCSAVYSTSYQTSTKAVPIDLTTTGYKPSTWTSTRPTIITSVYTTFKPATTTLTSTVTSTYVVTSTKTSTSLVTSSTTLTSLSTSSTIVCKTIPVVTPVYSTSTDILTSSIPYVIPCTGEPLLNNISLAPFNLLTLPIRNHHIRNNSPFGLRKPMPGYLIYNFDLHNNWSHFYTLPHDYHHDYAEHIHYVFDDPLDTGFRDYVRPADFNKDKDKDEFRPFSPAQETLDSIHEIQTYGPCLSSRDLVVPSGREDGPRSPPFTEPLNASMARHDSRCKGALAESQNPKFAKHPLVNLDISERRVRWSIRSYLNHRLEFFYLCRNRWRVKNISRKFCQPEKVKGKNNIEDTESIAFPNLKTIIKVLDEHREDWQTRPHHCVLSSTAQNEMGMSTN